jgi:hypothetical protein
MIALLGELGLVAVARVVVLGLPVGGGGARRYVVIAVLAAALGLQNATVRRLAVPDHQWQTIQEEEHQNEQLLQLSNQILELTKAIHAMNSARSPTGSNGTEQAASSSLGDAVGQ